MPRTRKPKSVLVAEASPKARHRADEPQPEPGVPTCPKCLDAVGRAEFKRLCTELSAMGVLFKSDVAALAVLADCWSRWRQARECVATEGILLPSPQGAQTLNPAARVVRDMADQILKLSIQFGLTPRARTGVAATKPKADADPESLVSFMASAPVLKTVRNG